MSVKVYSLVYLRTKVKTSEVPHNFVSQQDFDAQSLRIRELEAMLEKAVEFVRSNLTSEFYEQGYSWRDSEMMAEGKINELNSELQAAAEAVRGK